jgi:hypothetical protein
LTGWDATHAAAQRRWNFYPQCLMNPAARSPDENREAPEHAPERPAGAGRGGAGQRTMPTGQRRWRLYLVRAAAVVVGLALWHWTQALLGARQAASSDGELATAGRVLTQGDAVLQGLAGVHGYLAADKSRADALLIASSAANDALGVFLLAWAVLGRSFRPFVGLLLLFLLRQISQALCALPAPQGLIWHDPGFPSLLVTYSVANDFFFSGHTALAVYGCIELGRFGGTAARLAVVPLAAFLIVTVLALRAHYTMDVFTGALAALLAAGAADRLAPHVDDALARLVGR